ncbi:hypothetical protein NDN08_000542 [Rhodosorus marinus]|uniref:1-alkyl-2-acetylglycerophosphocholine esterase n=1 Tax=Rhodosorus marinus TaxID=101924 RepID=A0AAV8USE2_9RHOD|nr:hypothetical protein NDN08_000542 [Rhodosorus marinus]
MLFGALGLHGETSRRTKIAMGFSEPSGPFPVGCRRTELDSIPVNAFYPCVNSGECVRASWWPQNTSSDFAHPYAAGLAAGSQLPGLAPIISSLSWVRTKCFLDAPIEASATPCRPVVFSHGLCSTKSFYSAICSEMASQGLFVLALEHSDGTACACMREDPQLSMKFQPGADAGRDAQLATRVAEMSRALSALENGFPEATFDMENSVAAGHSLGATAALVAASADSRFKTAICLDCWSPGRVAPKLKPNFNILFIRIDNPRDPMVRICQRNSQSGHRSAAFAINRSRAQHNHQTDFFLLLPKWTVRMALGRQVDDAATVLAANNRLCISFLLDELSFTASAREIVDSSQGLLMMEFPSF